MTDFSKFGLEVTVNDVELRMTVLKFVADTSRGKSLNKEELLEFASQVEDYVRNGTKTPAPINDNMA